jgi:hypothetical protein
VVIWQNNNKVGEIKAVYNQAFDEHLGEHLN